jgi:hypothetical protein
LWKVTASSVPQAHKVFVEGHGFIRATSPQGFVEGQGFIRATSPQGFVAEHGFSHAVSQQGFLWNGAASSVP